MTVLLMCVHGITEKKPFNTYEIIPKSADIIDVLYLELSKSIERRWFS